MMKRLKLAVAAMALIGAFGFLVTTPAVAHATPASDACDSLKSVNPSASCGNKEAATNDVGNIIKTVINILSVVVGAVSVVMLIVGGFRYVISGGDSNGVSGAKNTILYAIVGLVIVLFAQIIVRFVLDRATANPSAYKQESSSIAYVE